MSSTSSAARLATIAASRPPGTRISVRESERITVSRHSRSIENSTNLAMAALLNTAGDGLTHNSSVGNGPSTVTVRHRNGRGAAKYNHKLTQSDHGKPSKSRLHSVREDKSAAAEPCIRQSPADTGGRTVHRQKSLHGGGP